MLIVGRNKKMILSWRKWLVFVYLTGGLCVSAFGQQSTESARPPYRDLGPITPYDQAAKIDTPDRSARNSKYNSTNTSPAAVAQQVLTEKSGNFLDIPPAPSFNSIEDPLPLGKSDAVLVGTITTAKSYLSTDKTWIYSEFHFLVSEALKAPGDSPISSGSTVDVERGGGRIRFPSGEIITRGDLSQPMPVPGGRYVLLLHRETVGNDYSIIRAYRLEGGHVYWLESPDGDNEHPKEIPEVSGQDETQFLSHVRGLLASNNGDSQ